VLPGNGSSLPKSVLPRAGTPGSAKDKEDPGKPPAATPDSKDAPAKPPASTPDNKGAATKPPAKP
jgi:hypothetical protein